MSDATAGTCWSMLRSLVAFVDKRDDDGGAARRSRVLEYITIAKLDEYFAHFGLSVKDITSYTGSCSSSWLMTLKRRMNSLTDCFVWPELDDVDWWCFKTSFPDQENRVFKAETETSNPRHLILCFFFFLHMKS